MQSNQFLTKRNLIIAGMACVVILAVIVLSVVFAKKSDDQNTTNNSSQNSQNNNSERNPALNNSSSNSPTISPDQLSGSQKTANGTPILSNFEWLIVNKNLSTADVQIIKNKISGYIFEKNQGKSKGEQISWIMLDYNNVAQDEEKIEFLADYYVGDTKTGSYDLTFASGKLTLDGKEI